MQFMAEFSGGLYARDAHSCSSNAFSFESILHLLNEPFATQPAVWNSLRQHLISDLPTLSAFKQQLKAELGFSQRHVTVPNMLFFTS